MNSYSSKIRIPISKIKFGYPNTAVMTKLSPFKPITIHLKHCDFTSRPSRYRPWCSFKLRCWLENFVHGYFTQSKNISFSFKFYMNYDRMITSQEKDKLALALIFFKILFLNIYFQIYHSFHLIFKNMALGLRWHRRGENVCRTCDFRLETTCSTCNFKWHDLS